MIKTKQELLNHFSDINAMYNNPFMYQTLSNMIDELLEQQPAEDCVSRKEAINVVHSYFQHYLDVNDDICLDGIRTLPSVQPQRKRGKWLWELAPNGWANHICSECGFKENTDIHVKLNWQFCPNCGADMRGDTDETN